MRRLIEVCVALAVVAIVASLVLVREGGRREVKTAARPAPATPMAATQPRPAEAANTVAPDSDEVVDEGAFLPDPEGPDDLRSKVNINDPESVLAYREYQERKARENAERLAPILYEDAPRDLGLDRARFQAMLKILIDENARANS